MNNYDLNWLKEKGFFKKEIFLEISGTQVFADDENLLAYLEISKTDELEKMKKELRETKFTYIWFYFPSKNRIKVFRRFGEVKWFYYSPEVRSDYLKSKTDKLFRLKPESLSSLFDVRDIVNKFYDELWKIRLKMAKSITQLKEDGNRLLTAQHLIDRLIFLYFLAQLNLVKIKTTEKEWILDRQNTREFFEWICSMMDETALQEFLNKTFFDILGKVDPCGWSSSNFKINGEEFAVDSPCLDGGLFIDQQIEGLSERKIKIKGVKQLILEVLNCYNWIIGEILPEEEDVIGDLTPEIIGHIYEKFVVSLEQIGIERIKLRDVQAVKEELRYGRKKVGAYYTPEEVTNYISNDTIYPYLKRKLEENGNGLKTELNILLEKGKYDERELEAIKQFYFSILRKIRVCDDACGSGSFLIAAGEVLLSLHTKLINILETNLQSDSDIQNILKDIAQSPSRTYYFVRQIIVNNLYGVDIMEGGIEIAKLRFWLWLISQVNPKEIEGRRIETLPNLDFNLMTGNSLVGFTDIDDVEFDFISKPKARLQKQKKKQVLLSKYSSKEKIDLMKRLAKARQRFKTLPAHEAVVLKEELSKELDKARDFLNREFYESLKTKNLGISFPKFQSFKPFHWGFEFYEVFDLEKSLNERGFDIIIGNPPYIDSEAMVRDMPEQRNLIYELYTSAEGNWDLYIPFYELAYRISNKNSSISYITPNKWLAIRYGRKLREVFKNKIAQICDCSEVNVFVDAGNSPVITFIKNEDITNEIGVHSFEEDYSLVKKRESPRSVLDLDNWGIFLSKYFDTLMKMLGQARRVSDLGDAENPFTVSEAYDLKKFLFDGKGSRKNYLKLINTGTIDKYISLWGHKTTAYIKDKYTYPIVKKGPFKRAMPRRYDQSNSKKIIISGIRHFECYLDSKCEYVAGKSTVIIRNCRSNTDFKLLLSILNSKAMSFYIKQAYNVLGIDGGVNFTAPMISSLPIPIVSKNTCEQLINKVNKIIEITGYNNYFKVSEKQEEFKRLKGNIDTLVYQLFGLSEKEQRTIELCTR